ncbi:hypothetical protein MUK42_06189 [Musa troglodytarum]|uniref:Uncharacterized protein n=1 Tax=Musa troglodytarum TaxID=320322 RepID=A0A9E7H4L9_9LILI|nr:hypothetical protein MUK42_06189 [Musa troglodytarum]
MLTFKDLVVTKVASFLLLIAFLTPLCYDYSILIRRSETYENGPEMELRNLYTSYVMLQKTTFWEGVV